MTYIELTFIAFGLSMDCFAVAIGLGTDRKMQSRNMFTMAILFGIFQGMMPLLGWMLGSGLRSLIDSFDHWIAFGILAAIGAKMIWQAFNEQPEQKKSQATSIWFLLTLSVATSIDAFVTGISFGLIEVNILHAVVLITVITFLVSVTGAKLGRISSFISAKWAEMTGGIVLVAIGVKVLSEHMF